MNEPVERAEFHLRVLRALREDVPERDIRRAVYYDEMPEDVLVATLLEDIQDVTYGVRMGRVSTSNGERFSRLAWDVVMHHTHRRTHRLLHGLYQSRIRQLVAMEDHLNLHHHPIGDR